MLVKKNGRKYRKIQKIKEKRNTVTTVGNGGNEVNTDLLASANIIVNNPIINENKDIKQQYIELLKKYVKIGGWNRRKYIVSQINSYTEILNEKECSEEKINNVDYYKKYLMIDLLHIIGFNEKLLQSEKMQDVKREYYKDFPEMTSQKKFVNKLLKLASENNKNRNMILEKEMTKDEETYISSVLKNLDFISEKPKNLMVTATMSAGKSTFINAITGKYISLSQNMACTSKIHTVIGKVLEDGYSSEYDHELVLNADKDELLNDNEDNASDRIVVSTYYNGILGGERIVINDSPGVNFSGDSEHKEITNRLLKSKKYDYLIYLMNATQIGTNDEDEHLEYVKKHIGKKAILFVLNKIDMFDPEEEDVIKAVDRVVEYIKSKGFKNPSVCPVSSYAAYLSKASQDRELSRIERRELYYLVDKFEKMRLVEYYNSNFPMIKIDDAENEEMQLQKTCGFAYVEKIIKDAIKEEK